MMISICICPPDTPKKILSPVQKQKIFRPSHPLLHSLSLANLKMRTVGRLHQLLQRGAAILEQRGTQPQLDGCQIADAQLGPLPLAQGYEGLGFRAAFGLALGRRQAFFFLRRPAPTPPG